MFGAMIFFPLMEDWRETWRVLFLLARMQLCITRRDVLQMN
jgi:hypothetical protein